MGTGSSKNAQVNRRVVVTVDPGEPPLPPHRAKNESMLADRLPVLHPDTPTVAQHLRAETTSADQPTSPLVSSEQTANPENVPSPQTIQPASEIKSKCITFLNTATSTGGQTVQRASGIDVVGVPCTVTSKKRDKLQDNFLKSLKELHATGNENYTDAPALKNLLTVCEMSDLTDESLADSLVEKRYPELFYKMWKAVYRRDIYTSATLHTEYVVHNLLKMATINFTHVSRKLCAAMGSEERGIIPLLAEEFEHPVMSLNALKDGVKRSEWDSPRETLKKTVNILANIIRNHIDNKPVFRQAKVVPHLQTLLDCRFLIMRAKALFALVYLINEDENEALNTADDNIKFVIKVLDKCLDSKGHYSEHYTFSAAVVVDGIAVLAANDSNKVKLVKNGVIPKLITMMKTDKLSEKQVAAYAIWKLAFHDENKNSFKNNDELIKVLKDLAKTETDSKLVNSCCTVLWLLGFAAQEDAKHRPKTARKADMSKDDKSNDVDDKNGGDDGDDDALDATSLDGDESNNDSPHVMISYQWDVQKQIIKVKEYLRAAGYNVWMDIDNMGASTLESMAAAVETSVVVLICFTDKYKMSASCRTEAEYTYKLHQPIIPLRLQEDYDPDGWLGIMIGAKLYIDLSIQAEFEENLNKLKNRLGERGRVLKEGTLKSTTNPHLPRMDTLNNTGGSTIMKRGQQTRRSTQAADQRGHIDAKSVSGWTSEDVNAWLVKRGLGEFKNRFDGYNGERLLGLKTVALEAPDFFYSELKKDLGFKNLLEIVKFKQALDGII